MVEQLSKTQRTQQKALENLHSVVQLCNKQIAPSPSAASLAPSSVAHSGNINQSPSQPSLSQRRQSKKRPTNIEAKPIPSQIQNPMSPQGEQMNSNVEPNGVMIT